MKKTPLDQLDTVTGPDRNVNDVCLWLKKNGWSWSRTRDGLSRCSKRFGQNRRKSILITVRVGVKGRIRNWEKGELSVGLTSLEWTTNAREAEGGAVNMGLLDRKCWERAHEIIREKRIAMMSPRADHREKFFVLKFKGPDIPTSETDRLFRWLTDETAMWDREVGALTEQVEFLLEEGRRRMEPGYL